VRFGRVAAATSVALLVGGGGTAVASQCSGRVSVADVGGAAGLRALNAKEWSFGPRPTGSPGHASMVRWLDGELQRVHASGMPRPRGHAGYCS
jgi:hypothetical protein